MIRKTALFFIGFAFTANAYAGINGSADPRVVIGWLGERPDYVPRSTKNQWNKSPYNSIVKVERGDYYGTGEFISPRHVLTNAHVAEDCGTNDADECGIYTSDDDWLMGRVVFRGMKLLEPDGRLNENTLSNNQDKDWAILEIDDYCRKEYRDFQEGGTIEHGLWRAGFGSLRVLTEKDIDAIRKAYLVYLNSGGIGSPDYVGGMNINSNELNYEVFRQEFERITGKDFDTDYDTDYDALKLVENCQFRGIASHVPYQAGLTHSCNGWSGDSGSAVKLMMSNDIVGLHVSGFHNITADMDITGSDTALAVHRFLSNPKIQKAIEKAKQECAGQ